MSLNQADVAAVAASASSARDNTNGNLRALDINPLAYLEKIRDFDGRREDLSTFCTNVDDIIPTLTSYNEQAQKMCINVIRSKMIGKARRAMEIHPHITSWADIKAMLMTNFGGFATADQLYEELRAATYRGNTIDFYNYIQHKLAMLNQKAKQEDRLEDVCTNISTALKIFVARLPVHMRTVLCALKPTTMEEALHELSQSGFLNEEPKKNANKDGQRKSSYTPNNSKQQNSNWKPKIYNPNNGHQQQQQGNQQNQFQTRQYQHSPGAVNAEPMEVDTSQQTRYQNHHQQQKVTGPEEQNIGKYDEVDRLENFPLTASGQTDYPIFF